MVRSEIILKLKLKYPNLKASQITKLLDLFFDTICENLIKISKNLTNLEKKIKINFIKDRPGHDIRYALNSNKIKNELKWKPKTDFKKGIKLTFDWYNNNKKYYKSFLKKDILKRLGSND